MLKIENAEVLGWEAAIRGMRNPLNSWDKSDSHWGLAEGEVDYDGKLAYYIGENDLKLMKNLAKAGDDHGKVLRYINVTFDLDAPIYFWKEFDTYRVGVAHHPTDIEMNSCSTMHKIHSKEFTLKDFSFEHLHGLYLRNLKNTIIMLNDARDAYLIGKDKTYWWQMIQLLPTSYNQKRTIQLNYQVLKNMYHARRNHKLDEWRTLCEWMEELPYFKEICVDVYKI